MIQFESSKKVPDLKQISGRFLEACGFCGRNAADLIKKVYLDDNAHINCASSSITKGAVAL